MGKLVEQDDLMKGQSRDLNSRFLDSLFGITSEQVMMIDPVGEILFTNKVVFKFSSEEAMGKNVFDIVPNTYALLLRNKIEEINRIRNKVIVEWAIETKKGRKDFELIIAPVYDQVDVLIGYTLASQNTTPIKAAIKNYNYKSNLEKLLLNISAKFINLPVEEVDNGIVESLELIGRFTNSEHAYIVLFNQKLSNSGLEWHSSITGNMPFCNMNALKQLLENAEYEFQKNTPMLIKPFELGLKNDCPILVNPMMLESKKYGALVLVGKVNSEEDWSKDFTKPMMLFSNVFINTMERKRNSLIEKQREVALEKAIKHRTIAIEGQKDKLVQQANKLAKTDALLRQANEKLKQANSSLEKTVSQRTSSLEKTNQELDRFVYSVSHDIKAPLASVKGLINLVRLSPSEELENSLSLMDRSIDKLNGFVEDILTHSRNSRVELTHNVINFEKEIEYAAEGLRHMDNANKVKLITSFKLKAASVTDQYRLQSVLKNLISNSVKYHNPEEKISWVKVTVESTKERIRIKVSDNGIGIDAGQVDKIFDMFYRASNNSNGSGLGLYIVQETIKKLGGTITVTSKEHVGTTFSINIPNLA